MLDHVWSEARHDYVQKIHCCGVRKTLNELLAFVIVFFFFNRFSFLTFMPLLFSGRRRSQIFL